MAIEINIACPNRESEQWNKFDPQTGMLYGPVCPACAEVIEITGLPDQYTAGPNETDKVIGGKVEGICRFDRNKPIHFSAEITRKRVRVIPPR